jgi:NAD-dependent oxidoreductase involved in siderophore biosynthesis
VCGQSHIKIANKIVDYKDWQVANINYVQDLLRKDGKILTREQLYGKYGITPAPLQYESLISAIPSKWNKLIANEYTEAIAQQNSKQAIVNLGQIHKRLEDATTNEIYWHCVNKI